ncbi:hypothetical protein ARMSODRAFT_957024 [Armillaria solidipes]|nr:hypothetical protein ARMSODRAFT_957024 [Armillaria solidipes]
MTLQKKAEMPIGKGQKGYDFRPRRSSGRRLLELRSQWPVRPENKAKNTLQCSLMQ